MSYQRLLLLATLFAIAAFLTLVLRLAHPHHRHLALLLYGVGWIPFLLSIHKIRIAHKQRFERIWSWKGHVAVGIGMLVFVWAFMVLIPVDKSPLSDIEMEQLSLSLDGDLQQLAWVDTKMQIAVAELQSSPIIELAQLSTAESKKLWDVWERFIEASYELEVLKTRYRGFYQINGFTHPELHAKAFVIAYGAFVSQYRAASIVTTRIGNFETAKKFLDDAHPSASLPAGSFARLQSMVSHPDEILRLNAGRAYLQLMRPRLDKADPSVQRLDEQLSEITQLVLTKVDAFANNPLDILEYHASQAWYPVQESVALGMASVRTVSRDYFISHEDLKAEASNLLPGDIMLTRREWHLTNLGIPGYWTHAALHLGSVEQMDRYFGELELEGGKTPSAVIRGRFPQVYRNLVEQGEFVSSPLVIEALRPGVIIQTLEESARADSLAVLRPKVTKQDRWKAVLAALQHYGKPYNYQFDFRTESALVCSQLVCKAYETIPGLHLEPQMSGGRLLFAPNEIAIKFDREIGTPVSELEFVLFLDGTDVGNVVKRNADEFRTSWSRPKWHIVFHGP